MRERDRLRRGNLAENTKVGYALDWALFERWCAERGCASLPAASETVTLYLTDVMIGERKKITTAQRRACAIAHYHRLAELPAPFTGEVRALFSGARRLSDERPRQMRPLTVAQLRRITEVLTVIGGSTAARDAALLVVGLASGLRCSTLVGLRYEDLEFSERGAVLYVRREKQDQEGRGRSVGLPRGEHAGTCPVRCLQNWLTYRGRIPGPLFCRLDSRGAGHPLDRNRVRKLVKSAMELAGFDSAGYGGHSLRSGLVTEAAEAGCSELVIASQTGHRSVEMLKRYYRRGHLWRANAAAIIGL